MIGVDLVYLPEFESSLRLGGRAFINKSFNTQELKNETVEHLAGVWAAKEAAMKALGNKPGDWLQYEVEYSKSGQPSIKIGRQTLEVSIAHHGDYAVAVVTEKKS